MPRREFDRIALPKIGSTDAVDERSEAMAREASKRCAPDEAACKIVPDHSDQQEAWAIAAELIADLGASDAVGWADDYLRGLQEKGDRRGMQRWGIVVSALDELVSANVH